MSPKMASEPTISPGNLGNKPALLAGSIVDGNVTFLDARLGIDAFARLAARSAAEDRQQSLSVSVWSSVPWCTSYAGILEYTGHSKICLRTGCCLRIDTAQSGRQRM